MECFTRRRARNLCDLEAPLGNTESLINYVLDIRPVSRRIFPEMGRSDPESENRDKEQVAGMKNNFVSILNMPSDCNYFQFKSEKNWDVDAAYNLFSCKRFYDLNLKLLPAGLQCLPFHEKITGDTSAFQEKDIEKCNQKAGVATEEYQEKKENFEKQLKEGEKFSKSFEDLTGIKWEPREPKVIEPKKKEEPVEQQLELGPRKYWVSHRTELKEAGDDSYLGPSVSADESLELWLDAFLDD